MMQCAQQNVVGWFFLCATEGAILLQIFTGEDLMAGVALVPGFGCSSH